MKKTKRGLSLLLCLLLLLSAVPASAMAAAPEEAALSAALPAERYAPGAAEGDEALLEQYAQEQLDSLGGAKAHSFLRAAHDPAGSLKGATRTVYGILKDQIALVASGESEDMLTVFSIPVEDLGLSQTSWTAAELGLETLLNAAGNSFSSEAMAAVSERVGFNLRLLVNALLSACPYELYWYDKTTGTVLEPYAFTGTKTEIGIVGSMTFTFAVSQDYADGRIRTVSEKNYLCGVDRQYGARVSSAVSTAASIVEECEELSAYEKLRAYKDRICSLVDYNNTASGSGGPYGDPWQLISVFDGDTTTNVVCEGYAKAFQYLCDKSELGDVMAYSVSGTMRGGTGAGAHMWNLVRMDDGLVYLVDVTNCDAGSVGYPNALFLAGTPSGSVDSFYMFTVKNQQIYYFYADKTRAVFSGEELTLATSAYVPADTRVPGVVETVDELLEDIENGVTDITFYGAGSFLVNKEVSIPAGVSFALSEGTLMLSSGVSMTIASGATVTAYKAQIAGSLYNSGTFRLLSESAPFEVTGLLRAETGGEVSVQVLSFRRTGKMRTGGGYYYVEQEPVEEEALRAACAAAAESADNALLFRIRPRAAISLRADLTLPRNSRVIVEAPYSLVPAAGVTLTNNGKLTVYQSCTFPGRVVNEDVLTLAKGVVADFAGGYAGGGTLRISKSASDPYAQLTAPAASLFYAERGKDSYWELTLRAVWIEGSAPDGLLPAGLLQLEDEALAGCAFRYVKLPEGAESIGSGVFAGSVGLRAVYIPESVTGIATDAFDGTPDEFTIVGKAGSYAASFAEQYGIPFVEG